MRFRLVWYDTHYDDKFLCENEHRFEYFGSALAIHHLWFVLTRMGNKHVEVYSLDGRRQEPEKGLRGGMIDYGV